LNLTTVLYIILAAIVALAFAVFHYFYKSNSKSKVTILLASLRFLGIFSMLLLVINPKIETAILETVKPSLLVTIDNSSSIKNQQNDENVLNLLKNIEDSPDLNKKFDINYFAFDKDISRLDSLNFSINNTNIKQSLESLDNLYKENSAVLLVTDGNQTIGSDYSFHKGNSAIYPMIVGDTTKREDLKISKLNVNKYSFLGNNFPVEIFVNYNGINPINTTLTVKNRNSTIFRKNITLDKSTNSEKVIFNLNASNVGIENYKASLTYLTSEDNTINNHKNFSVQVINEQSKIAIVSDILHPDLGMFKRSIETNKQRKVSFHKPNENINLKEYQLVILYQPTESFANIFKACEANNINTFIVTGTQTDWIFLNEVQSDFKKDAISQTEDFLPILNSNYSAYVVDDLGYSGFSPLKDYFGKITFTSAFETLLFQNIGGFETEDPLLATFSKNNRRGATLFGENSWKWRALGYTRTKSFDQFDTFINKLIQYLATKKRLNRLELDYNPIVYQNDLLKISTSYYDSNYNLDNRADLIIQLTRSNTQETKELPLLLNKDKFEANLTNLESGDYSFSIKVKGQNISKKGNFTVLDYNIEQQFTHANSDALKNLAITNSGSVVHINNYQNIFNMLIQETQYKSIQKSSKKIMPLIDWKWLLGFIALFFSLEWFIRKYRGLI
jgi:hypothetical protein